MGLIRFLLALSIVAVHTSGFFGYFLVDGQTAVQSFFIISGFYMSLILNEKYIGKNNSYYLFITNRLYRLYPIYWTVVIGIVLISLTLALLTKGFFFPVFSNYLSVAPNFFSFSYLILTNIFMFGQDIVMFLGIKPDSGALYFTSNINVTTPRVANFLFIPPAWSLGVELAFYLIAPFILRKGFKVVVTLIAASFLIRFFLYNYMKLQIDVWTYRFFPNELMFFLFGYITYRIYLTVKDRSIPSFVNKIILAMGVVFTLVFNYLPVVRIPYFSFTLSAVLYFATIILSIPFLFNYLKNNKVDREIGELSYPIYISHTAVILASTYLPYAAFKPGWVIALITIAASYLLNLVIAAPVEKFRQRRLRK